MTTQQIEQKALNLTRKLTTGQLIEGFEATNSMSASDPATSFVRGNFMDVLEERDSAAFEAWMDCDDVALMESPRHFYAA
jgi:hypothetical protein